MPVSLVVTDTPENPGTYMAEAMDPLIYMGGARECRKLGEKTGYAYSIGRKSG